MCSTAGCIVALTCQDFAVRHLIYSIVAMPETACPDLMIDICERDPTHLVRTVAPLLLLVGGGTDDDNHILNAEAIIHLWYSAKIPTALWTHYKDQVNKNTAKQMEKEIEEEDARLYDVDENESWPPTSVHDGKAEPVFTLDVKDFETVTKRLIRPSKVNADYAALVRAMGIKRCAEPLPKVKGRMSPSRAEAAARWRSDGILLPYDHPRTDFDMVNP